MHVHASKVTTRSELLVLDSVGASTLLQTCVFCATLKASTPPIALLLMYIYTYLTLPCIVCRIGGVALQSRLSFIMHFCRLVDVG